MSKVKCEKLPADFCLAWDAHVNAWKEVSDYNENYQEIQDGPEYYRALKWRIDETYQNMLTVAHRHGADFRY
jgi:hypothetical protein